MNRLHGSVYDGLTQPDGLSTPAVDGADQPQIAMGEYGHGFVTSSRVGSHELIATDLGDNGVREGASQVNALANVSPPYGVPAIAGLFSDLIAWQHDPGPVGVPEIRVRCAPDGSALGPELVVSSPSLGPTDAKDGLAAAGDGAGDAAISWVQGTGGTAQIVASQLYTPPGSFAAGSSFQYARGSHPLLAWSAPREQWGPIRYSVTVDGAQVAQSGATSVRVPSALPDGPHSWQVTAANPAGLTSTTGTARVFVDTVAPTAALTTTGARRVGAVLRAYVRYHDAPPAGEPRGDASGVAEVVLDWGDGTVAKLHLGWHRKLHSYRRPGRYRVTVAVTDRAGNTTRLLVHLKIVRPGAHRPRPARRRRR